MSVVATKEGVICCPPMNRASVFKEVAFRISLEFISKSPSIVLDTSLSAFVAIA